MDSNIIDLQYKYEKPWGNYENFLKGKNYLVKIINIETGHQISLQKHRFRDEHWVILEGECEIIQDKNLYKAGPNDYIFIKKKINT